MISCRSGWRRTVRAYGADGGAYDVGIVLDEESWQCLAKGSFRGVLQIKVRRGRTVYVYVGSDMVGRA